VLHENNILLEKLSPENIFVSNFKYVIGDFGISQLINPMASNDDHLNCLFAP
jgi:serine/threonine protein kinase